MIEIKPATSIGGNINRKISEIFVECFGQHFTFLTKDTNKLVAAFEHMFYTDVFYVALIDGKVAGITALTDGKESCINENKKELRKHLGYVKGTLFYQIFQHEFHKPAMLTGDGIASVEFVATASEYRGKGVASAIIHHLFAFPQYQDYVLEAADTNINAVRLYEKLGFREFKRIKQKFSKFIGVNHIVHMKYSKTE